MRCLFGIGDVCGDPPTRQSEGQDTPSDVETSIEIGGPPLVTHAIECDLDEDCTCGAGYDPPDDSPRQLTTS